MRGLVLVLAIAGCSGGGSGDLVMTQANNYTYSNTITLASTEVQPGVDLAIDWSGLTTDVRGRTLDPSQAEQLGLLAYPYPLDELLPLLEKNKITENPDQYALFDNCLDDGNPCTTSAAATQFLTIGNDLDPAAFMLENSGTTYLLTALNKPRGTTDLLMTRVFVPTATSTNTDLTLANGDTTLDWSVDLTGPAMKVDAGAKTYSFDWSGVGKDVFDNDYNPGLGDALLIGHYSGMAVADVEAQFLQLDDPSVATEVYRAGVGSATNLEDLSVAVNEAGEAFPGFDDDGTWLIGIQCSVCSTPVPLLLSIVTVN